MVNLFNIPYIRQNLKNVLVLKRIKENINVVVGHHPHHPQTILTKFD